MPDLRQQEHQQHRLGHVTLVADEPDRLRRVMESCFGLRFHDGHLTTGERYSMFEMADGLLGGIMRPQAGQPVGVTPFIEVEDAAEAAARCLALGVPVVHPVTDVAGRGRFFMFQVPGSPILACWETIRKPGASDG